MKQEDIIRMAREAGFYVDENGDILEGDNYSIQTDLIERFAALIAAHEREACAKVCEEGGRDESGRIHVQAWGCAKAIRARGQV